MQQLTIKAKNGSSGNIYLFYTLSRKGTPSVYFWIQISYLFINIVQRYVRYLITISIFLHLIPSVKRYFKISHVIEYFMRKGNAMLGGKKTHWSLLIITQAYHQVKFTISIATQLLHGLALKKPIQHHLTMLNAIECKCFTRLAEGKSLMTIKLRSTLFNVINRVDWKCIQLYWLARFKSTKQTRNNGIDHRVD